MRQNSMDYAKDLLAFINKSVSPYHSVMEGKRMLLEAGFRELKMGQEWHIQRNGKYYVSPYPTALFAIDVGEIIDHVGFKIIASHTDSPCFKIKPKSEIVSDGYMSLNTEVYGGPIFSTWFDRPLSIAGKVALKSKNPLKPEISYVDFKRPLLTIPSLAIHMNRQVNKGVEIHPQKHTLPLVGQINDALEKENYLLHYLAEEMKVDAQEILDFDLYLYVAEEGHMIGFDNEFLQAPKLDDLAMVYGSLRSIIQSKCYDGINIAACFDSEEIGSGTKAGADSALFANILERLSLALNRSKAKHLRMFETSFIISADGAHALHPNAQEEHDPTNRPVLNKGIVLKLSAKQSYATDCESTAAIQQLCDASDLPYQKFVNRSGALGGKTIGPIISSYVPVRAADVGLPMLAMHSTRELIGIKDLVVMDQMFNNFYHI
ncbi:M18 family aminopeptidase [Vallitalea pronyensis]|uniref:M18 family aminopeptidase n=1 Tax=Vallitalea pronyensis TaxID=1348613 RepID=A0A8J8SG54_9FIRM|nr:M18 family aminopeptidase [Vallitalea pronyensis]QUI22032.1 M18 family aminopeptidase [Vallitalea pronyensis]